MSVHTISATPALCVELAIITDLPTGEPQPPADDHVWWLVQRFDGATLWRRILLGPPAAGWRPAPADQSHAPTRSPDHGHL